MHEADDAYSIQSTWSCYWLDQILTLALNTLILSFFYISLDLSTIYFTYFSGCWASFVCNCHSILECCVIFSGVKLSIRSFNLLPIAVAFYIWGNLTTRDGKADCLSVWLNRFFLRQVKHSSLAYVTLNMSFSSVMLNSFDREFIFNCGFPLLASRFG